MATQDLEAVIIEDDDEEKQVLTKITSIWAELDSQALDYLWALWKVHISVLGSAIIDCIINGITFAQDD